MAKPKPKPVRPVRKPTISGLSRKSSPPRRKRPPAPEHVELRKDTTWDGYTSP